LTWKKTSCPVLSERKKYFPIHTGDSYSSRLMLWKYPMIKSSSKPSKRYGQGLCIAI
jgi:hypothetical protein